MSEAADGSWEAAIRKSDSSIASLQRIASFFRTVAQTEADYGKKLLLSTNFKRDGTLTKDDVSQDYPAVSAVWDGFQRQLYDRGSRSVTLASELEELMGELDGWCKDHAGVKKSLVEESYKLKKELSDHLQAVKKAQLVHEVSCAEADKLVEAYAASGRDRDAKKRAKQAVERAGKAHKEYREAVHDANKYRSTFSKRLLPELLEEVQTFEESRLEMLRELLVRVHAAVSGTSPSNPSWAALSKLLTDIDPAKLASLARSFGANDSVKNPIEVIPYDPDHTDFVKSRTARIKGNEDIAPVAKRYPSAPNSPKDMSMPVMPTVDNGDRDMRESAHFAEVMPNTVVALGVESKREILRAQLSQLQVVILTEKRVLMDLISLIRFYGPGAAANRARDEYVAQKNKFQNLLGARKQVFAAMEKVGTTPSVLSTLRKDRYATAPGEEKPAPPQQHQSPPPEPREATPPPPQQQHEAKQAPQSDPSTPMSRPASHAASAPGGLASGLDVRGYCLFSYKAMTEKELSFSKYEVLVIRDMDESGWWYCENKDGQLGFCPANFLKQLAPGEEAPVRKKKKKKSSAVTGDDK